MKIAAAQLAPVWGDPTATTERVVEWVGRAAQEGVELVAFPETFLSGYPFWVEHTDGARFDDAGQRAAYASYVDAAIGLDGPELARISEAVRDSGVFTYLGVTERSRSGGTVYATLVALDPRRGLVGAHRKLMPTHEERLVWGTGDGHGLRTHPVNGIRVGGLNCWENWMSLARHALYAQGLDLHVAVWPGSVNNTRDITRFIAMEGRCYVLSVAGLLRENDIAPGFPLLDKLSGDRSWWREGGSAIAGPDGEWLVEPTPDVEGLITAEIDPALVRGARQNFDPAGHYGRPDVLRLEVDRRRLEGATFVDGG